MGVFGHGGGLSKLAHGTETVLPALAGAAIGAGLAYLTGGASLFVGGSVGMALGNQLKSSYDTSKYNERALGIQREALTQQQIELERQKKREIEQQKRENEQLMNSVSSLTNTTYSGVSSPTIDYDKYGDLG